MAFLKMNNLLKIAEENKFGVPAINVFNYESIKFAVMAADEAHMPLIIQYWPGFTEHARLSEIQNMAMELINNANVPICLHQDHSATYEIAIQGLAARFPSIMIDGSALPYEENVLLTKEFVKCAHKMDVTVEAELGHVGFGDNADDFQNTDHFTNPEQAIDFVNQTQCDLLAISVGNAHGNYVKTPVLDFDRIQALREALNVPLVMHGGSDIPYVQMQKAVQCGMSKFNIATEYQRCFYRETAKFISCNDHPDDYFKLLRYLERPCINFVKEKIEMLNPNHFSL